MLFILTLVIEFKFIVLEELNNIESLLEFNNNLPEFSIICSPSYWLGIIGDCEYDLYEVDAADIGINWVDVK